MEVISFNADSDAGEACVCFAGADPVFMGHFPNAPVLPGVVLIDTAVEFVARAMKKPLRLERLSNVKFCRVVLPDEAIRLVFKTTPDPDNSGRIHVSGRWFRDAEKVADMNFWAVPDKTKGGAL